MEEQAVGYYLEESLYCENDEEQILHTLLERHKKGETASLICPVHLIQNELELEKAKKEINKEKSTGIVDIYSDIVDYKIREHQTFILQI